MCGIPIDEIQVQIECLHEDESPHDSFSACMSKEEIDELWRESRHNEWLWCCVRVTACYTSPSGKVYEGTDYLGACSYDSEKSFKDGGYFEDMKNEAIEDLLRQLRGEK